METTRYNVFGWKIDKCVLEAGESFNGVVPEDVKREDIVNNTLYTKGLITGKSSNPNVIVYDRVPGFYNTDLPPVIKAQQVEFKAELDSEFWCLNFNVNGRKQPVISILKLSPNEMTTLPAYTKLLVCHGNLITGSARLVEGSHIELVFETEFHTNTQTYCMLFS